MSDVPESGSTARRRACSVAPNATFIVTSTGTGSVVGGGSVGVVAAVSSLLCRQPDRTTERATIEHVASKLRVTLLFFIG